MAFLSPLGATGGASDSLIYDIIFRVFFKLQPCLSAKGYGCVNGTQFLTHDIIFNLLLPHVLIIGFIYMFIGGGVIQNRTIKIITGITTYIIIISLGWYGFLASTLVFWFVLLLGLGLLRFIFGGFIHPGRIRELGQAAYMLGRKKGNKKELRKKQERLKKQLEEINKRIDAEKAGKDRDRVIESLNNQRHDLELEIGNIEDALR